MFTRQEVLHSVCTCYMFVLCFLKSCICQPVQTCTVKITQVCFGRISRVWHKSRANPSSDEVQSGTFPKKRFFFSNHRGDVCILIWGHRTRTLQTTRSMAATTSQWGSQQPDVLGSHCVAIVAHRGTSWHIAARCTQVAVDTPGGLMVPNIKAFDVGIGYFPVCRMQQQHVSSCVVLFFQRNSNTQKTVRKLKLRFPKIGEAAPNFSAASLMREIPPLSFEHTLKILNTSQYIAIYLNIYNISISIPSFMSFLFRALVTVIL